MLAHSTLLVHSIETFGTHDGPGIRMVIFLQSCNIECIYCQNPDTISLKGGKEISIAELTERAVKMIPYFGAEGGVTISGGEPLMQAAQILEFIDLLHAQNIHVNIDTNGTIVTKDAQKIIEHKADLIMFDVKATNSNDFIALTGIDLLTNVMQNITLRENAQKPFWLRYVVIPGYTDKNEQLDMLKTTFSHFKFLQKIELIPYHTLGVHKWEKLCKTYSLTDIPGVKNEYIVHLKEQLSEYLPV